MKDTVRKGTYWVSKNPLTVTVRELVCEVTATIDGDAEVWQPMFGIPIGRNPRIPTQRIPVKKLKARFRRIPKTDYIALVESFQALPERAQRGAETPALKALRKTCAVVGKGEEPIPEKATPKKPMAFGEEVLMTPGEVRRYHHAKYLQAVQALASTRFLPSIGNTVDVALEEAIASLDRYRKTLGVYLR